MHGKKSTRWHWISLPLKHTEQTIYKESGNGSFQGFFQLLTLDKWEKINWHHWKECLKISNIAKFESDLLKAMKILLLIVKKFCRCFYGGGNKIAPPPRPTIQTSVYFCNFGKLYLSSLKTYYFHIWQFY